MRFKDFSAFQMPKKRYLGLPPTDPPAFFLHSFFAVFPNCVKCFQQFTQKMLGIVINIIDSTSLTGPRGSDCHAPRNGLFKCEFNSLPEVLEQRTKA